ncbi:MAG: PaaI family thioesterase [Hamadaea sp.]|nr:PaaI family thioesterase [Hamadaea sp.]
MTQTQQRSRTFEWDDPFAYAAAPPGLTGLEQLQLMIDGTMPPPPVMRLLDMEGFQAWTGRVVVRMRAREFHYNPLGTVHGGMLATLLDTAAGCSVHSSLPAGMAYTSLDLTTKFLRPVTVESGLLTCEGTVVSQGRRTALAQAQLTDEAGRLVAHATSSCLLFPIEQ